MEIAERREEEEETRLWWRKRRCLIKPWGAGGGTRRITHTVLHREVLSAGEVSRDGRWVRMVLVRSRAALGVGQ